MLSRMVHTITLGGAVWRVDAREVAVEADGTNDSLEFPYFYSNSTSFLFLILLWGQFYTLFVLA